MKKIVYSLLLLLLCGTKLSAQVCAIVDSFNVNSPQITDADYIGETQGVAFGNNSLWVSINEEAYETFQPVNIYIYQYSPSGNLLDSIPYSYSSGYVFYSLTADDDYVWALQGVDSLYQFSIATKSQVKAISLGGREAVSATTFGMCSIGDTVYFIGQNNGHCFKYAKSTGVIVDYPNYIANNGAYPNQICAVGNHIVTNTFTSALGGANEVSVADPGTMKEDVSAREAWCVNSPNSIAYGDGYFWQGVINLSANISLQAQNIYKVESNFASLGVSEIAQESDFIISPNPVKETINITYPGTADWRSFTVSLVNVAGTKICSQQITDNGGKATINVGQYNLSSGMYFIELSNGAQRVTKKITVL